MITILQGRTPKELRREVRALLGREAARAAFTKRTYTYWVGSITITEPTTRIVRGDGWELVLCPDRCHAVVLS